MKKKPKGMTPGVHAARKAGIAHTLHSYDHDPSGGAYGAEAAEKLGVSEDRVFKTLVVCLDGKDFAVAVVPVSAMLNMKLMARATGAKKAAMADKADVQRLTGYVVGGVSPLGQKKPLATYIHTSAEVHSTVFVSAGRRGVEIELAPRDLQQLTRGEFAILCES